MIFDTPGTRLNIVDIHQMPFLIFEVLSGTNIQKKSRYLPNTVITPVPPPHPSLPFSQTRKQILLLKRLTFTLQCLAILQAHIKKNNITRLNLIHCCQSLKKRGETTLAYPLHTWDPQ